MKKALLAPVVIDEARKLRCAVAKPGLELLVALGVLVRGLWAPTQAYWLFFVVFFALAVHAGWQTLGEYTDRFVITNVRVFRVMGRPYERDLTIQRVIQRSGLRSSVQVEED